MPFSGENQTEASRVAAELMTVEHLAAANRAQRRKLHLACALVAMRNTVDEVIDESKGNNWSRRVRIHYDYRY